MKSQTCTARFEKQACTEKHWRETRYLLFAKMSLYSICLTYEKLYIIRIIVLKITCALHQNIIINSF